jgi:hypothetical protein
MAFGPRPEGCGTFRRGSPGSDGSWGDDGMERFVQGLLHGLEAPLAQGLLQDALLLWVKLDCHGHTISPARSGLQFHDLIRSRFT